MTTKQMPMIRNWTRSLTVGLALGAVTLVPAQAHAILPAGAAAVVAFYKEAYDLLSLAKPLFEDSAPDLVAALNKAEADIIAEVRSVRNQEWKAHAQSVFDDFQILGMRKRTHKDNKRLWGVAWDLSRQTINDFVEIVNARDTGSAYEMAPAFNALVATNGQLTKMMGEIYPNDPPTWGEYDLYFKHGIRADYAMIGMQKGLCWPGYDPGAGAYGSVEGGKYVKNTYKHSIFYEDKLANQNLVVDRITICYPGRGMGCNWVTQNAYCNPGKHSCTPIGALFPKEDSLATAEAMVKPTFMDDPTVQTVREAMRGIMSLGGGDDNYDNSRTDLPEAGQYTEPWIYEPACVQAVYPYKP